MGENSRIEDLRRRVQKDPSSIAFAQLAEECRRAGELQEAVDVCRTGLDIHPGYLSARVTLGRALLELNQLDEAQLQLETVLRSAPENLAALRALAETLHHRGELGDALTQYRAALSLAHNDPDLQRTVAELAKKIDPAPPPPESDGLSFEQAAREFLLHAPPPVLVTPPVVVAPPVLPEPTAPPLVAPPVVVEPPPPALVALPVATELPPEIVDELPLTIEAPPLVDEPSLLVESPPVVTEALLVAEPPPPMRHEPLLLESPPSNVHEALLVIEPAPPVVAEPALLRESPPPVVDEAPLLLESPPSNVHEALLVIEPPPSVVEAVPAAIAVPEDHTERDHAVRTIAALQQWLEAAHVARTQRVA